MARSKARGTAHRHRWPGVLLAVAGMLLLWGSARASGPRWVTGPPYFTTNSQPVVWYTRSPVYYTDPGDLSASVNHAAADALVNAAATVWNVPTSSLVLAQGGQLAEHVSGANVYPGQTGLVFPVDVSSADYATIQIAVIYDSDGSVTDLLLGQGASDASNCRQTGVTESVDAISRSGTIQHALMVLNGRCSGPAPEQQLQLQYQLMRAFGRVLGLGWSQVNDNVFTDLPLPTAEDVSKWPIMHPIDIVCGTYTYQCQPEPFVLRPDDIASISQLYFLPRGSASTGKTDTLLNASTITGVMQFGNAQGMQGMNLLVRRKAPITPYLEASPVVSAVSGNLFRWNNGNPVTGPPGMTVAESMGSVNPPYEGAFSLGAIPMLPGVTLQDAFIMSEPINPLYTGQYGIGPYQTATVTPSGPAFPWEDHGVVPYESNYYTWSVPGSVSECAAAGLGSQSAPLPVAASGWWTDVLCGYGASAWSSLRVRAKRSVTVEATSLDEQGLVTESKLQPLLGAWGMGDPLNSLPTIAAAVSPFNSIAAGLTTMNFDTPQDGVVRLVLTDQRGDGRPDYGFRERVLYADSISPANLPAGGGVVIISGSGFRPGNTLTIGGAPAQVIATTSTSMVAVASPYASLPPGAGAGVDVVVSDLMTGGATSMYGAVTYSAPVLPQTNQLNILTPAFYVASGQAVNLTAEASLSFGGASAAQVPVIWSDVSGLLTFAGSGQTSSDANGIASIGATASPLRAGQTATGQGCAWGSVCGAFVAIAVGAEQWTLHPLAGTEQSVVSSGRLQSVTLQVRDQAGDPVIGVRVDIYQAVTGYQVCPATGRCPSAAVFSTSATTLTSDANGLIVISPQQTSGSAEITTIAASAGLNGFLSMTLQKLP